MVHGKKERKRRRIIIIILIIIIIIIIIIRNGAKTISLQVGVTIESYGKLEISYINVNNF
jgi:accessory gene regulator protein AgrB